MTYSISMMVVLMIGMLILVVGILMNKEPGQSLQGSLRDSFMWGTGFLISFGAEFVVLANV